MNIRRLKVVPRPTSEALDARTLPQVKEHYANERIGWGRAAFVGICGSLAMMALMDTFNILGYTTFSYEVYAGSLLMGDPHGTHSWTFGFFANWVIGAIFGCLYAAVFEYVFKRADAKIGAYTGVAHTAFAAITFFPLFNAFHRVFNTGLYPHFGILGSGINRVTPLLILLSHVVFGLTMGTFYGPVRQKRMQTRAFEPGESGMPGERDVITPVEDPLDRKTAY